MPQALGKAHSRAPAPTGPLPSFRFDFRRLSIRIGGGDAACPRTIRGRGRRRAGALFGRAASDFLADISQFQKAIGLAAQFVGDRPLVAHNASFDRKFWQSELARLGLAAPQPFACTVLLSRRLYPDAPNHKLGTLAEFHALPRKGRAHRALSDAELTAELLLRIQRDLRQRHGVAAPGHDFLQALQQCSKATLPRFWQRQAGATA